MIEKPTDIELANARRYREKMEGSSEPDAVIDIYARALEWSEATLRPSGDTKRKETITVKVDAIEKGGCYTPPLPPDNPVPPSERPEPAVTIHADSEDERAFQDLEAYRYQVAGQKDEIQDKVDFIQEIRQAMSAPPDASLLHFFRGFLPEVQKSRGDRDFTNSMADMVEQIGDILGQKKGEDILKVAKDRQFKANAVANDLEVRNKIYGLLEGKPGETLTNAATRVVAEIVKLEEDLAEERGRHAQTSDLWKKSEAASSFGGIAKDTLQKIREVLGAENGESIFFVAEDLKSKLAAAVKKIDELEGQRDNARNLSDHYKRIVELPKPIESDAAAATELVMKLCGYCRKMSEVANCPDCGGSVEHLEDCNLQALMLSLPKSQAK